MEESKDAESANAFYFMKFILGQKMGMTQVFLEDGAVVPVTRIKAGPCQITQIKNGGKDNSVSVQIGYGEKKSFRLTNPMAGHLKSLDSARWVKDFVVEKVDGFDKGDIITVETFAKGDVVRVIGTSKGKGFAGVVKRHGFHGGPATHGHKDNLRAPGSIGAGGVQRVFKNMRMAGRMGGEQITVKNLEVVEIHPDTNEIYLKGAVPGGRNGLIEIYANGDLKVVKKIKDVVVAQPAETDIVAVEVVQS